VGKTAFLSCVQEVATLAAFLSQLANFPFVSIVVFLSSGREFEVLRAVT
jgi:hypothetical protein